MQSGGEENTLEFSAFNGTLLLVSIKHDAVPTAELRSLFEIFS